jgi:hypothetical protein
MPSAQVLSAAPALVLRQGEHNLMIRKLLTIAIAAIAFSLPAKASTYNASFDGSFFDVFAQITTDGSDNVTAITGTVAGVGGGSIGGLAPLGNPSWIYDNKFTASSPYVSNGGILFSVGAFLYNLYSDGPNYYLSTFNPDGTHYNPGDVGTLAVAQTPLPGALWLFGSALAGLWGMFARRRRSSAQRLESPAFA